MSTNDPINDRTKRGTVITAAIGFVVALAALFGVYANWPSNADPGTEPTPTPVVTDTPTATPSETPSPTPSETPSVTPTPTPVIIRPTWQATGSPTITFTDEFNGTSVDTAKWETGWFGTGITGPPNTNVLNCYDTKQVSESGGYLRLTSANRPAQCTIKGASYTKQYVSGMVTSRNSFNQQYGAYEARICLPDATNDGKTDTWAAWWLNGPSSVSWPKHGELDIMEGLNGGTKSTVHYVDANGTAIQAGAYTTPAAVGCHTMGVQWTSTTATFYYDGKQTFTHAFLGPYPEWLILNNQLIDTQPGVESEVLVDWVRVWAPVT